ncbi:MAG: hypothetical protein HKL96_11165 [Phycisphaerales bacterium]|nr:hypothetical protein [Phycisphaerales bacterium]
MTSVSQSQPPLAAEQPVQEQSPAATQEQLEGLVAKPGTETDLRHAIEQAFSYRGDITVLTTDGRKIEGYIFDRLAESPSLQQCYLRLMQPNGQDRVRLAYSDIAELHFTGRDAAAGKSFQTWIKKYNEKKAAGEKNIRLEPEPL